VPFPCLRTSSASPPYSHRLLPMGEKNYAWRWRAAAALTREDQAPNVVTRTPLASPPDSKGSGCGRTLVQPLDFEEADASKAPERKREEGGCDLACGKRCYGRAGGAERTCTRLA